ncbi:aldehyde dehydrogenase family 16 member A1 isoform X2 [Betta splendens]|uniref:Aldehyde dehydrogenase family 16 member A1 isoform X2 n=1 Tax=Betta splendens TaxID=158456 RepID=A0A6P7N3B1_BETSP|nr:aldehyde dehydrogenase family 16 member A1 isoform X2 [Betta splendens]
MADSTNKSVYDIFLSMEKGPAQTSSTATAKAWLDHHSQALGLFINGKFVRPADRPSCLLLDSKGGSVCSIVCAVEDDISQCASSAVNGFKSWSSRTCYQRAQVLLKLVSILGMHGKCVSELCEASCSPSALVRLLQYYSSWAQLRDILITNWRPLGVVAVVASDDCSLYPLYCKVLPALAMGNSVIVVPGQCTAPAALLLAQLFTGAGLPSGALNVVTRSDFSLCAKVAQNPSISYVTYIGNKEVIQSCSAPPSGAVYPPTLLCGTAPSSPCVVWPSSGPLLPVMSFRSNTEAVTLANHSPHGKSVSIWTEDLTLALETAKNLSFGSVWVNCHSVSDPCLPVCGQKDSGNCTDGGQEGLYQFLKLPSSSSPLPRSSPLSMDYTKFGTGTFPVIIPEYSDQANASKSYLQFVGGKACKSVSGCSLSVQPPGGSGVLAYCPDGGRKDVRNAVEAAIKVQSGWIKKGPTAHAQSLYSLAKGLEAKRQDFVMSVSIQTGLSMDEAEKEVELSIARLSDWASYCDKIQGGTLPMPKSGSAYTLPEALGVVGVILPDKNPLLSMVTVLGAAIATGNAIVMVPSQKYPLPALDFIQVLQVSDLPAGLVNVISGGKDQLTVALANHSVIKAIWYWGSAEGCQYLQYTCTTPLKTLCLFCQNDEEEEKDWTHPSLLEEMWRNAVQWKSVWIPTA